jgi:hypothetical protein
MAAYRPCFMNVFSTVFESSPTNEMLRTFLELAPVGKNMTLCGGRPSIEIPLVILQMVTCGTSNAEDVKIDHLRLYHSRTMQLLSVYADLGTLSEQTTAIITSFASVLLTCLSTFDNNKRREMLISQAFFCAHDCVSCSTNKKKVRSKCVGGWVCFSASLLIH